MAEPDFARLDEIVTKHDRKPDRLIPILQETQSTYGYLPEGAMRRIADALGIPVGKVYGVATFYSLFAVAPKGKHIIRVCESAPCHVRGAEEIFAALEAELGIAPGQTTADGFFTFEHTSCLGVCGVAPVMMIDDVVYGNLTMEKTREIIASYRRAATAAGE
ncbi:MAG: NADH-quinone oxidoreductase subunit NuoE [Bacteroidota bacterium]